MIQILENFKTKYYFTTSYIETLMQVFKTKFEILECYNKWKASQFDQFLVNRLLETQPESAVINDFESTWRGIEKFETNFEKIKQESSELIKIASKRKDLTEAQLS